MAEGSHISEIYQRLRSADDYHPYSVNTFGDWSTESGDMITVSRDGRSYTVPVGESTTTWRGRAQTEYSATGDEERTPISKISKKKFSGGGGGMSQAEKLWRFEVNQEHLLYDVYDPEGGLYAFLEMTVKGLRLLFQGMYDGLVGLLEMTRSRLRIEFWGLYDGLFSSLEFTRSRLRIEFLGLYDGLSSSLELTRSHFQVQFTGLYDGLYSSLELTRSRFQVQIQDNYNALNSYITQTASAITMSVRDNYNALNSSLIQTASSIRQAVHDNYEGLHASMTLTASSLSTQINDNYAGLSSRITQTASSLSVQINDNYSGLSSRIAQTASSLSTTIGTVNTLSGDVNTIKGSQIWQDRDKVTTTVGAFTTTWVYKYNPQTGKYDLPDHRILTLEDGAQIKVTRSGVSTEVVDKGNLVATINADSSGVTIAGSKINIGGVVSGINSSSVTIQADKINLSGKVLATEFTSLKADFDDLIAGRMDSVTIKCGRLACTGAFTLGGQQYTAQWLSKYVITGITTVGPFSLYDAYGNMRTIMGIQGSGISGRTIYYVGRE